MGLALCNILRVEVEHRKMGVDLGSKRFFCGWFFSPLLLWTLVGAGCDRAGGFPSSLVQACFHNCSTSLWPFPLLLHPFWHFHNTKAEAQFCPWSLPFCLEAGVQFWDDKLCCLWPVQVFYPFPVEAFREVRLGTACHLGMGGSKDVFAWWEVLQIQGACSLWRRIKPSERSNAKWKVLSDKQNYWRGRAAWCPGTVAISSKSSGALAKQRAGHGCFTLPAVLLSWGTKTPAWLPEQSFGTCTRLR